VLSTQAVVFYKARLFHDWREMQFEFIPANLKFQIKPLDSTHALAWGEDVSISWASQGGLEW
jgi:hypothetical protein